MIRNRCRGDCFLVGRGGAVESNITELSNVVKFCITMVGADSAYVYTRILVRTVNWDFNMRF